MSPGLRWMQIHRMCTLSMPGWSWLRWASPCTRQSAFCRRPRRSPQPAPAAGEGGGHRCPKSRRLLRTHNAALGENRTGVKSKDLRELNKTKQNHIARNSIKPQIQKSVRRLSPQISLQTEETNILMGGFKTWEQSTIYVWMQLH